MAIRKLPAKFEACDGRTFDTEIDAERYNAAIVARHLDEIGALRAELAK